MKKTIALAALFLIPMFIFGLIYGCGSSSSPTTTTTLGPGASAGETASGAVKGAYGVSQTSTQVGNLAGAKPTTSSIFSIKTLSTPPTGLFDPLPTDGKIQIPGFVSGETVTVLFYDRAGNPINGSYLSGRNIANMTSPSFDWQSLASGFNFGTFADAIYPWINYSTDWDYSDPTKVASFYSSATKYRALSSFWDYMCWSYVIPGASMEAAVNGAYLYKSGGSTLTEYPKLGTPEAASSSVIGNQLASITGTHPNGETVSMTMLMSTDATGMPTSGTGEGTVTRPDGAVMTMTCSLTFTNGSLASGGMDLIVTSPDNLHVILTMTSTGAAQGTVYDRSVSPEVEIGTLVIFPVADSSGHIGYFEEKATGNKNYF